jgi:hypothetical protein
MMQKKLIQNLGLGYQSIHACKNGCTCPISQGACCSKSMPSLWATLVCAWTKQGAKKND